MAKEGPSPVVSSSFCYTEIKDLEITRKSAKDANGNLIFHVKDLSIFSFHEKKVIVDATGLPVVTLRAKGMSMRGRWEVFRGESTDDKQLIFSARRSSFFQMKSKIHVFLANNKFEDGCDYMIQGSWFGGSFKIYAGDFKTIIAQVEKKIRFFGKDKFMVRVYPNIDEAFIVALIIILDAITRSNGGGGGGGGG